MNAAPRIQHLTRTAHGWTADVDDIPVHITDGNAYWMKDQFNGHPLTMAQQHSLDCAAVSELHAR